MAAMFVTFILQIAVRYVVGSEWFAARLGHVIDASPFGWTLEFCLVLWVWIVFWGNAFIVRERDHVTFDILYFWVRPGPRKWFADSRRAGDRRRRCSSSIGPTYEKMRILRLKSSATLPVKMLPIYSIYFLFLAVVGLRYALARWSMPLRNGLPEANRTTIWTDDRRMSVELLLCVGVAVLPGRASACRSPMRSSSPRWSISAAAGPSIGIVGKNAPGRHLSKLPPAGRAAVHRRRQHHECRHDHRPAAEFLRRDGRAGSRAGSAMSTSWPR